MSMPDSITVAEHWATMSFINIDETTALVTSVEVNRAYRGRGYGTNILRLALSIADERGVTLLLGVAPDGTGLDAEQLIDWYGRHGFERLVEMNGEPVDDDRAMVRRPTSPL